jgi:hypothetical protein
MSIAAVSVNLVNQQSPGFFHERGVDLQRLRQDLQAGNLSAAQQDFNAIQALAKNGPFANGNAFEVSQRQQDFAAVGQALQAGDLAGARQALSQLWNTFPVHHFNPPVATANSGQPSSSASSGPEITLNLGNVTAGEQITIGVNNTNGAEQVTFSVSNQQNPNPEQITINLNQNSNEHVVLNLLDNTSTASAQRNGLSVSA